MVNEAHLTTLINIKLCLSITSKPANIFTKTYQLNFRKVPERDLSYKWTNCSNSIFRHCDEIHWWLNSPSRRYLRVLLLKGSLRPQRGFFIMASVALSSLHVGGRPVAFWNILIKTERKNRETKTHITWVEE